MKNFFDKLFLFYCTLMAIVVTLSGFLTLKNNSVLIFLIFFLPVTLFLTASLFKAIFQAEAPPAGGKPMKKLMIYYNFIIISILVAMGFLNARTLAQLVSAVFFFPLAAYFTFLVWPKKNKAIVLAQKQLAANPLKKGIVKPLIFEEPPQIGELIKPRMEAFDFDRRKFLKLIGSAGISVFLLSLFTKKAEAAFFGSVPGPGTVSLKDTSGSQVDPAVKQPTDGYRITELDDSSPAYYGYVNKNGAWFIMKEVSNEDGTSTYLYTRDDSDFTNVTTGWPNRANLTTYDYFDEVFD